MSIYLTLFLIRCFASCEESNSKMNYFYYNCEEFNNTVSFYYYQPEAKTYTMTPSWYDDEENNESPTYNTTFFFNPIEERRVIIHNLTPYFKDLRHTVRSKITNSVGSIKGYCESEKNDYNSKLLMCYVGIETNVNYYKLMDAKSFCYCSVYYIIFFSSIYNDEVDLETFYWTTFDLKCPVRNPIRKNLNYYRLKKKLFKQIELIRS